ncbi:MAG: Ig-like domain-containing protein, partial [Thermoplasmata archaeon]|nr:Ig-like domain-containing protein [Thermoplasmata archaeon]
DRDLKVVEARSSNDNSVYDSAAMETQVPFALPFLDDMEAGSDLWEAEPYWHIVHNETLGRPWNLSYGGEYAWWYGIDANGNYEDSFRNYGSLTSPPIDLTDSVAAELTFHYWYETENSMEQDQRWLMVRTGNSPWPEPGQPGTIQLDLRQNRSWLDWTTNLSTFGGKIIQVRFFFDTVNNVDNDYQGWYVDDFFVNQTIAKNTSPTISIQSPSGGESWSGGTNHTLVWSTFDSRDSSAEMLVWLNYSLTGGEPWLPLPGAQGIPADSTPHNLTLPLANSTSVVIEATVVDTGGLRSYDESEKFEIDSKPPQVSSFSPQGNDVRATASIVVMFDEMMNRDSLASSFSLLRTDTWEGVLGDLYTTNQSMFFDPLYNLEYDTQYTVNVSMFAKDDSSPGNPLIETFSWTFRTTTTVNEPPEITIVSPFSGASWTGGSEQQISWVASDFEDPTDVLDVWLNYSSSKEGPWVPIPGAQGIRADGSPFNWSVPLVDMPTAWLNATVKDSRGAWTFNHSQTFEIDSTPPSITAYSPMGLNPVPVDVDIRITFSEGMAKYGAESAFKLSEFETGNEVPGVFSWQGDRMTFTPVSSLSAGTSYKAEIDSSPRDDSVPGNLIVQNYSWIFQTETGDIIPPTVVDTIPDDNQVDVSVSISNITITFNESMNRYMVVNALTMTPQVSYTPTWANNSLVITLNEPLDYDKGYVIRINGSVARDPSNNLLDGNGDGTPGDDFLMNFWTEERGPAEALDILPFAFGLVILVIILLFVLYLLRGKRGPGEEEEKEPEEEKEEVEKELREIDEILGIWEKD